MELQVLACIELTARNFLPFQSVSESTCFSLTDGCVWDAGNLHGFLATVLSTGTRDCFHLIITSIICLVLINSYFHLCLVAHGNGDDHIVWLEK